MRFTRPKVFVLVLLTLLCTVYVGGCRRAGKWLAKEEMPPHADAMVILMGNFPDRVLQTVDLWHEKSADRIIIVEEGMGPFKRLEDRGVRILSNSEQAANALVTLEIPADSITILPGDARSTLDESLVIRDYLADRSSADTILLVSSASHMRRASLIFKEALSESDIPVYVGCSPSAYTSFNADKWWKNKEDIQIVLSEYLKITSFVLFEKRTLNKQSD